MVWFRVDDQFYGSKEVMAIPSDQRSAAVGLWCLAGAWSAAHLTDGHIPEYMLETFGGSPDLALLLVRPARLWTRKRDGYVFRNWEKWQITRQEVEKTRQAERDRKAAYRQKRQQSIEDVPGGVPVGQIRIPETPTQPNPTQPIKEMRAEKRGTRIPDGFAVTPAMAQWAMTNAPGVDIRLSTEKFINYWTAKTGQAATKLDWPATWRNWLLTDQERAGTNRAATAQTSKAQKNADKYHELYGDTNERTRSIQAPNPGISKG